MNLLTGNTDTENILIHLLNLNSMHNYLQLSKKNYNFLTNNLLFQTIKDYFFIDKIRLTNDKIIYNASKYGNVDVLNWFKNSGFEFKYFENAINWASKNNHVEVLNWFKNNK